MELVISTSVRLSVRRCCCSTVPATSPFTGAPGSALLAPMLATGIITTIAGNGNPCAVPTAGCGDGGPATSATLTGVRSLAFDPSGNLYIGDTDAGRIRRVDHTTQTITTYAGNGVPCLNNPP